MEDNYPTPEELLTIEQWPIRNRADVAACLDWIGENCWHYREWGWDSKDGWYHISTGGWSGNEDTIQAMRQNHLFWSLCFVQHRVGGHYILKADTKTEASGVLARITKRFEVWAEDNNYNTEKDEDAVYLYESTRHAFRGWAAAKETL